MVDAPTYANSPLANPEFLASIMPKSSGLAPTPLSAEELSGRVANARSGAGAKRDFGQDLKTLNDAELNMIYGTGTAQYRNDMSAELDKQRKILGAQRSVGEIAIDSGLAAAKGFVGVVGGLESAAIGLAGKGIEKLSPESTGVSEYATRVAESTNLVTESLSSFESDKLAARKQLSAAEALADAQKTSEEDDGSFISGLVRVGKDVINTGERVLRDGAVTGDVVAEGLGSLGPSAKIAAGLGSLAQRKAAVAADAIFPTAASARLAAAATVTEKALIATGVGISEASGTYTSTVDEVMSRSYEEMLGSPEFVKLLQEGVDPESAQRQVANNTGVEAYGRQMPTAMAAGILATRFNASPLTAFEGQSFVGGLREVGVQALEEGIQGGTGELNKNLAIQNQVDPNQDLLGGVGDSIATGAIGGAGMAGAIGGVQTGLDTASTLTDIPLNIIDGVSNIGGKIPAKDILSKALDVGGAGVDLLARGAKAVAPTITETIETLKTSVAPAMESVKAFTEKPNVDIQTDNISSGVKASILAQETLTSAPDQVTDGLRKFSQDVDTAPAPAAFADTVAEGSNLIDTVTGVMKTFAKPDVSISRLSDADILFASKKFNELQSVVGDLPSDIQAEVQKVLASPDFVRVQKRASRIDLNEVITPDAAVTADVKATTVAVARTNPANVNPDIINKILEQDDRTDLTEDDIKLMGSAARIARTINDRVGRMVEISKEKNVALTARGGNKEPVKTLDQVSRSIQVSGLNGNDGGAKLRSVNDFAADIFKGAQSTTKTLVGPDGINVPVGSVIKQFGLFVQHMSNKVEALNQSYDANDDRGTGPTIPFDTLINGKEMRPAGRAGSSSVYYHRKSEKSVELSKIVHADAVASAEVYNTLVDTFPELFPAGKVKVPVLRGLDKPAEVIETKAEVKTEKVAEKVREVSNDNSQPKETPQNTTAVEEVVSAPAGTATEQAPVLEVERNENTKFVNFNNPGGELLAEKQKAAEELMKQKHSPLRANRGKGLIGLTTAATNEPVMLPVSMLKDLPGAADENRVEGDGKFDRLNTLVQKYGFKEDQDGNAVVIGVNHLGQAFLIDGNTRTAVAAANGVEAIRAEVRWFNGGERADGPITPETVAAAVTTDAVTEVPPAAVKAPVEAPVEPELQAEPEAEVFTVSDLFMETFTENTKPAEYSDADTLIDLVSKREGTEAYVEFAKPLVGTLVSGMQNRLQALQAKMSASDLELGTGLVRFKNMMLLDPTTGLYNEALLGLGAVVVVDWLTSVRGMGAGRLEDTLEDLGLTSFNLSTDDVKAIMNSVPVRQAVEKMAKDMVRLWNVKPNVDASMVDIRGATEGLIKELLVVLSENTNFIDIIEIKVAKEGVDNAVASALDVSGMKEPQKIIGLSGQNSVQKTLHPEDTIMASIGELIQGTDQTQSRGNVPLSKLEKAALKRMQDTPHYKAEGISDLITAIGFEPLSRLLGWKDPSALPGNHPLRVSIEGKNISIQRDFDDAMLMVDAVGDTETPVYYPVGISKVGRHQMKGINPQNNKILRAMITPTRSTLNMENQADRDAFWLTVAQATGLAKVESKPHGLILSTIQEDFTKKYGDAVQVIESYLETGTLNTDGLVSALGTAEVAQLNAVFAVASLNVAKRSGKLGSFETSLSFELDGKTDGPANMMSNFGQGVVSESDYMNFKRVGFFLGETGTTLNQFFSEGNVDLYETTSKRGDLGLYKMIAGSNQSEKAVLYAAQRFAGVFGDFKINEDGSITMTRNTAKNPMTKTVYGSGVKGVGEGIAQEMMLEFYAQLIQLGAGVDLANHFNYPNIENDIKLLFGQSIPAQLDINTFQFSKTAQTLFADVITKSIGTVLSQTAKTVIGDKITGVNDLLVFITGVQTQFISQLYQKKLDELVEARAAEGKISKNKQGKGVVRELSQRDYDELVKELRSYSPIYSNGSQTLAVGSFSGKPSDIEMSSTMDNRLRVKATMATPDIAGVKVIPYISIGRGDAMMMNTIYGSDVAPTDTIPVFDGIDMPISKIMAYANQINEAVMNNWDSNVLGDILTDFERFMGQVSENTDLLDQAFEVVKKTSFNSTVVSNGTLNAQDLLEQLKEAVRQNQARKAVFKRIAVSVDHMGGSQTSYVRGTQELSRDEINQMIQAELGGQPAPVSEVVEKAPVVQKPSADVGMKPTTEQSNVTLVLDTQVLLKALERETRNKNVRDTVRALMEIMEEPAQIKLGYNKDTSEYVKEDPFNNGETGSNVKAIYDVDNNVIIFKETDLKNISHETIAHEMIHMATFTKVLDHYKGTETNDAVGRLEVLMDEFMEMDFSKAEKPLKDAANAAKAQILRNKTSAEPFFKAVALNEFMAWTLSNEALIKELKATQTSLVSRLTKTVIALMKRLLGNVPSDMYSNILFNTRIVGGTTVDEDQGFFDFGGGNGNNGNGGNNGNSSGNVTPSAQNFTNFWIDLVRERLAQANQTRDGKGKIVQLNRYIDVAKDAVTKLDFGGFALSEYQKKTFMAIHAVLATEMRLDSQSLIAMGNVYDHVTNNLTPSMFGSGLAAQDRYSAVMELMGGSKNDEGVSDAIAVLLALSQTSSAFRNALDQIPEIEAPNGVSSKTLNELLMSATGFLMRKATGSIDMSGQNMKEVLDNLADGILLQDTENEFLGLRTLMSSLDKADTFMSGALSMLAQKSQKLNVELQNSTRSGIVKVVGGSVALAAGFLDEDLAKISAGVVKDITHMGSRLDMFVPVREFIAEVVGSDDINKDVVLLLDKVQFAVQAARQAYREELPVILQNEFQTHPNEEQWTALHRVLGKLDVASLFSLADPDDAMSLLSDTARLNRKIADKEKVIRRNFSKDVADEILEKSQQLADFMNGKGAGFQLWRNAYAIHKFAGGTKDNMIPEIDKMISLYALEGADQNQKDMVAQMHDADSDAVHNLIVYMQGLNREEELKTISEAARLNGYKGFVPDHSSGDISLIVEMDAKSEELKRMGYVRVGDFSAERGMSSTSRGYYVTSVKQGGNYSQGVLQQVQDSYRGVNATTGLTVNGTVSGVISGVGVEEVTKRLNVTLSVTDPKETLLPVYDDTGVLYYERALNPDLIQKYTDPKSNLALMLGAWAGRQVEEKFAQAYNNELVAKLKDIWDNRATGTDDLFIDMSDINLGEKDKVYRDSWKVIPPQTKGHILRVFGEDGGFMVRRDMINVSLGYRDASIVDVWSGKTRLPEPMKVVIKAIAKLTMGDKAVTILGKAEELTMTTISSAKDLIVVRSLVVPYMNTQSNVFQLAGRGIAVKQILKGYQNKFAEIDQYNENVKKVIELEVRMQLAGLDTNRVSILKQQRKVIEDENARMSIAPLVKAGAYKNISEGITDLDVSLTSGRIGEWVESQLNRLPTGVQTIAKYGMLSKDTALYRGANKAVQYGDFIAKSIYYDFLRSQQGLTDAQAMVKVNEEFINFSLLPGRMRTYLESMGATWFLTFKIRAMKVAMAAIRDNPVRSLMVAQTGSGPVTDNLVAKVANGNIDYSIGLDMLFDAPSMNPFVTLVD